MGYVNAMDRIGNALAVVASVLLIAAALVITWGVIWRAAGGSTYWEIEFSVYMMVAALFLASPYTLRTNGHVAVDLLAHYASPATRRRLVVAVAVLGALVTLYLAWAGAQLTLESFHRGERTESTWAPLKWPLFLMMPLGLGLTAAQYVAEIIRLRHRETPAS